MSKFKIALSIIIFTLSSYSVCMFYEISCLRNKNRLALGVYASAKISSLVDEMKSNKAKNKSLVDKLKNMKNNLVNNSSSADEVQNILNKYNQYLKSKQNKILVNNTSYKRNSNILSSAYKRRIIRTSLNLTYNIPYVKFVCLVRALAKMKKLSILNSAIIKSSNNESPNDITVDMEILY